MFISESVDQRQLVQQIHDLPQVEAIYIISDNPDEQHSWASNWSKIRGVRNQLEPICEALQEAVTQTNENLTPISFVTKTEADSEGPTVDLDRLDPSFMYTTLFKRILLTMTHEPDARRAIVNFCRTHYASNSYQLKIVEEFSRDYRPDKAIWWYTRHCFTYQLLNRALRLLESDIIVDMGFFIHDMHRQLEQLHQQQFADYQGPPLTLYRGQSLSAEDFGKLKKSQGGLLAFNSFLSTSKSRSVSFNFARKSSTRDNVVGILFVLTVDPTLRSAVFADIDKESFFQRENEMLFSMHTVFRIGDAVELDKGRRLFEAQLTLTRDEDGELRRVTDLMAKGNEAQAGWERLAQVLLTMSQVNKAEELYKILLEQRPDERKCAIYYHSLGQIENQRGAYSQALQYHRSSFNIMENIFPPNNPAFTYSYNKIGKVYNTMGDYSQALLFSERALDIAEKSLPADDAKFVETYGNMGLVFSNMREFSQALLYYEKALAIQEKLLPTNHPDLSVFYGSIALVYSKLGEYSRALPYHHKTLAIGERTLPANHPNLANAYNNIGGVYKNIRENSKALSYFNKALAIREKILPIDHLDLAAS